MCLLLLIQHIDFQSGGQIRSDQSLSHVRLFATPWIAARQASLSIANSRSSLRLTSIESVMPSSHLILCRPLLLLPPIPPSISADGRIDIPCQQQMKVSITLHLAESSFGLGSFPGRRHGNPLQYCCPENPTREQPGRSQRVGHNWSDSASVSSSVRVFNFTHAGGCPLIRHCGFNHTSLMTNGEKNLFVFVGHLDSFFCEVLVESLAISY